MIIKPFHFMRLFLKVQENILAIITNKSLIGMATYKDKLILKRVQEQLDFMVNKSWQYAPDLFTNIYLNAKIDKHIRALGMNATDQVAVSRIVDNFMGHVFETSSFSYKTLKKTMEETRAELLNQSGALSTMERAYKDLYVENIRKQGLVGFIDKANKRWSFGNYTKMLLDTSTRITNNYAVIYTYEKHDLYKIIGHANSCKKCAAHKNRVYSRSGTNKFYPSLASAFGKIDKSGLDTLENSYLSIHPNCKCEIIPFTEGGKTAREIEEIREFSNYETNPPDRDPRTERQIEAYNNKVQERQKLVNTFKEFQDMKLALGKRMPKTFNTFLKHKLANSEQFRAWKQSIHK